MVWAAKIVIGIVFFAAISSQRIAILPDEPCEAPHEMFLFITGLLDIFSDYFLLFLDWLLFPFVLVQTLVTTPCHQ